MRAQSAHEGGHRILVSVIAQGSYLSGTNLPRNQTPPSSLVQIYSETTMYCDVRY